MDQKIKKKILQKVHDYLLEKDYSDFRADLKNLDKPKKIVEKRTGEIFQPDMTANYEKSSYVFEIEMGENIESNKEKFIRKCKILQQYATDKSGKLYLIIPVQKLDRILTEINKNNLENIGILQIKTG
jgi:hypothetical protein